MPACANCARELRPEWKFCVSCGMPTGVTAARPETKAIPIITPEVAEAVARASAALPYARAAVAAGPGSGSEAEAAIGVRLDRVPEPEPALRPEPDLEPLAIFDLVRASGSRTGPASPEPVAVPEAVAVPEPVAVVPDAEIPPVAHPADAPPTVAEPHPAQPAAVGVGAVEAVAVETAQTAWATAAPPTLAPTLLVTPPGQEPAPAAVRTRSGRSDRSTPRRRVNALAVVALVLGCLAIPVAALFGHLALHQIAVRHERGRIPALIATVLGYGSLLFIVGLAVIYLTSRA